MDSGSSTTLALRGDTSTIELEVALGGFLAGYSENTLLAYRQDLRQFVAWCDRQQVEVFSVRRAHIELFARWLEHRGAARATIGRRLSTVAGFYRYCTEEQLVASNPAVNVRRPRQRQESTMSGLDRNELGVFLVQAGLAGPRDHALACLLALNGLRVSEALDTNVDDMGLQRGHHTLRVRRKGGSTVIVPLAPRTARTVYLAIGARSEGPILVTDSGVRMNRHQAARVVRRLAKHAGIDKTISPHSLRHSFITAALDAGVAMRDVQEAASHADPRTTMRYDRARRSLDRHATYIVATFVAGASR
ncbi:MAG: tyrosine-type recombinase/integrase [Acidimicrobiia bacterium]